MKGSTNVSSLANYRQHCAKFLRAARKRRIIAVWQPARPNQPAGRVTLVEPASSVASESWVRADVVVPQGTAARMFMQYVRPQMKERWSPFEKEEIQPWT
jgi:hypothetical protein